MVLRWSAAVLATALLLTGCSSPPPAAGPPVIVPGTPGGPNRTLSALPSSAATVDPDDITFLKDMMIHHTQAIQLSTMAASSAVNPKVKAIADRIRVGQQPEIEAMRQLLTARGETPPPLEHVQHMDHSAMPGMATPAQLASLQKATGKSFDTLFLQLMIKHHEGALTMSEQQTENGSDLRVGDLSQDVTVTQTKEIATMRQLLKGL
jgi:uncharacterized protein (DUF305 family)